MIRLLSLPFIITSSISLILGIFYLLLYFRLNSRYQESIQYYFIFSLLALVSSTFLGAFTILINSEQNLDYLNIANRITVIAAMFTIVLALHFNVSFFNYKMPISLKWIYPICILFSLVCIVPNQYFLIKDFYTTSRYYTGLAYGPLFQVWGIWILILLIYSITILFRVYFRQRKNQDNQSTGKVRLLLFTTIIWMCTGIGDVLTGIQVVDLPPLTWVGSFLVTCSIAWLLVLHIDDLYEDRRLLNNRLMYDHLTKAFSRSYFEIRLKEAIKAIKRKQSIGLYVCIIDVDDFKAVNDQYGHTNGDRLLKDISTISKGLIRPFDCFARLGGDEFALLLNDVQEDGQAMLIVERIRNKISETKFGRGAKAFNASCSFGLARAGFEHLDIDDLTNQLLPCADDALYASKHKGKNAISISVMKS